MNSGTETVIIECFVKQEGPAVAYKPARRESMPKIAPIRGAGNVFADPNLPDNSNPVPF